MTLSKMLANAKARDAHRKGIRDRSPYYPDFIIEENQPPEYDKTGFFISCLVRVEHDGTWYTVHCMDSTVVDRQEELDKEQLIKEHLRKVYLVSKFYEIDPDFEGPDGEPLDEVDDLQIPEEERLGLKKR